MNRLKAVYQVVDAFDPRHNHRNGAVADNQVQMVLPHKVHEFILPYMSPGHYQHPGKDIYELLDLRGERASRVRALPIRFRPHFKILHAGLYAQVILLLGGTRKLAERQAKEVTIQLASDGKP